MKQAKKDFLLEINVEELPVSYVRPALDRLKVSFIESLKLQRISHGDIFLFGTAARLICFIKNIELKQKELMEEVMGPPKRIAFDRDNKPTAQAIGFANNQGVDVKALKIKPLPKGDYVFIEKKRKSKPTKEILIDITPGIIKSITFPKTMKWDDSGIRFARPIESVAALLDKKNIKISIGNVPEKVIKNVSASEYIKRLKRECLIDPDERKAKIEMAIKSIQRRLGLDENVDQALLEEINFMVRLPVLIVGEFDKRFLVIPRDVLIASMSKYQRIFTVSKDKKLVNKFIAVVDGKGRNLNKIRKIYSNILEARLKDSLFFYNEDTKKPLAEHTARLKDLIFQKDLGNMFEKIERLKRLVLIISNKLGLDTAKIDNVIRAAELSKADLVTHMVGEFPSLQGIMGMEYALRDGEKKEVAVAIREHYLPQGLDDTLPSTIESSIVALSDKLDNLVGFIGMGAEVSGSFDPFGIRRNAQGLIQIIKAKKLRLDLGELIQEAIRRYGNKLSGDTVQLKDKILDYIKERIDFLSGEIRQIGLKEAVLGVKCYDIVDIFNRIEIFSSISKERYFLQAAKVVERTSNILKGAKGKDIGEVNPSLFKEDLEKKVWDVYLSNKDRVEKLIKEERYIEATRLYGEVFFEVLHRFFDKVLVNVEDNALRLNRLAMMQAVNRLYTDEVADLALLPQIKT